jgi:heterotetrameric sarcosine oxidase gamma subunit
VELDVSVVLLVARKSRAVDLLGRVQASLGLTLPEMGRSAGSDDIRLLAIQPGAWMVIAPRGDEGALARRLRVVSEDAASVIDQSHGKLVLRITSSTACQVLGESCRLDLHERSFGAGRVATTVIAQVHCTLFRVDHGPAFDVLIPANFGASFADWLARAVGDA